MLELIIAFAARLTEEVKSDPFWTEGVPNLATPVYTVDPRGKKYARIVKDGESVWGFVEIATGDIFKAAGWKAPAKHARGNIETATYGKEYVWTGPAYLR